MMFELHKTDEFEKWFKKLKNQIALKQVTLRLFRLENGHFGDIDSVGNGIYELRIHTHGGIRIYYTQQGDNIILLLIGGDKSTQDDDILKAKKLAKEYGVDDESD